MKAATRYLASCGAALLVAAAASADQGADADATETVVVNAYRTAATIGASTKTDTPLIETPQSVSVVTRDELDARGVTNLNEAVRYSAGVMSETLGIDNRVDDLYIRGFDAGSWGDNVTLDGMRAPQGSYWTRSAFDSWNMERIEVLKGPSAVLYGQVAPGGMVNQVSKMPRADQLQQLRLSVNGFGQYQGALDIGTALLDDDDVLVRLVGLYRNGPTQLDHVDQQHWFLAPSAKFVLGKGTDVTLLGMYQRDGGGSTFQFLPYSGTVTPTAYGYIDNTTFLGEPNWNTYNRTLWNAGWRLRHEIAEGWTFSQSARFNHVESLFRTTVAGKATLTDGRVLPRRAVMGTGDSTSFTIDTRIEGRFATGPLAHTVLIGSDWQKADWEGVRYAANVSATTIAIDVFDPVYTNYDFASVLTTQISHSGRNTQLGAYVQDQIALGNWRFTLSGRHDWFRDDTHNRLTGTETDLDNSAFTGRFGALYLLDDGFAPYFSYAESFQPSTYDASSSFTDEAFEPVIGKQLEAGVKYQPKTIDGMITLSAYELTQQNVATPDPDTSHDCGTGAGSCYVSTGEVRVRGIELEGRLTPFDGLSLIVALSHVDSEITKANNTTKGNDMIRVPQWQGAAWVDYTFVGGALRGLSLAVGNRYAGKTFGDTANTLEISDHALWDAAVRYDLSGLIPGNWGMSKAQFAINAQNIGDRRYLTTCTAATACFYGSGRTVTISLGLGW